MSGLAHELMEVLRQPELLQALATAVAPLLSGKKPPQPQSQPTANTAREEELLGVIRELKGTIRELRAALQAAGGKTAPPKEQSAAATEEQQSPYRAALTRRMKSQGHLIVKDVPNLGEPLQPTAAAVREIEGKHAFTAVQGCRLYAGTRKAQLNSIQQIGASKPVHDWKVTAQDVPSSREGCAIVVTGGTTRYAPRSRHTGNVPSLCNLCCPTKNLACKGQHGTHQVC